MEAKFQRQKALTETRRSMVLSAARTVFTQSGLERASIREIAKKAGYTPGAIYAYFPSKQHILSALLLDSLNQLTERVQQARPSKGMSGGVLLARAQAWIGFLASEGRDLELTLHILAGTGMREAGNDIAVQLQARLRESLDQVVSALVEEGMPESMAMTQREAILGQGLGLLLVQRAKEFVDPDLAAQTLFLQFIANLAIRYRSPHEPEATANVSTSPQTDLFG